jgi:hypothetical protein
VIEQQAEGIEPQLYRQIIFAHREQNPETEALTQMKRRATIEYPTEFDEVSRA